MRRLLTFTRMLRAATRLAYHTLLTYRAQPLVFFEFLPECSAPRALCLALVSLRSVGEACSKPSWPSRPSPLKPPISPAIRAHGRRARVTRPQDSLDPSEERRTPTARRPRKARPVDQRRGRCPPLLGPICEPVGPCRRDRVRGAHLTCHQKVTLQEIAAIRDSHRQREEGEVQPVTFFRWVRRRYPVLVTP
jgi:hypothetical protein